jgi:hypothetical protein
MVVFKTEELTMALYCGIDPHSNDSAGWNATSAWREAKE